MEGASHVLVSLYHLALDSEVLKGLKDSELTPPSSGSDPAPPAATSGESEEQEKVLLQLLKIGKKYLKRILNGDDEEGVNVGFPSMLEVGFVTLLIAPFCCRFRT